VLTVLDQLSDPGGGPASVNEDVAGHVARSAWVLDGATGLADGRLLPGPSDAAWLAAAYDDLLRAHADRADLGPKHLLADLIETVAASFAAQALRPAEHRYELPSGGMALVRLRRGRLEYARLGDCRAILAPAGGPVISTRRPPLHRLDARAVRRLVALRRRDPDASHATLHRALQGELRANRSQLNRPGGYWVLGTEPAAARHAETGGLPLADGPVRGLLVSDGFYRLIDTFAAYPDDAALLARALAVGLAPLLAELRALEDADPECVAHPRLKPKDDATALLFEATP
jgi:hypothetical protein